MMPQNEQRRRARARMRRGWQAAGRLVAILAASCTAGAGLAQAPLPPAAGSLAFLVDRGVRITMRDGTKLSVNVYRPPNAASEPLPAILMRTPYSKDSPGVRTLVELFTKAGYAFVVQDKRGRYESEGLYIVSDHEVYDSYDTIDWIARQPWSTGKVGVYGCSDPGDAAIYAAVSRHPALKAVIPEAAGSTQGSAGNWYRYFGIRNGGAVELAMGVGWMVQNGTKHFLKPPTGLAWEEFISLRDKYRINIQPPSLDYDRVLLTLPIVDILKSVGLPYTDWENIAGRDLDDPFFADRDFLKGGEKISVPALHVNSWYDFAPGVTVWQRQFFERNATNASARSNQFMIMSPSLHCQSLNLTKDYVVGERPLGDAERQLGDLYVTWFDHWLKGKNNGIKKMPKIQYYMMGENEWRAADTWPPPEAKPTKLYLAGEDANGPDAAGALIAGRPKLASGQHRFTYNPANPVPTIGGSICCIRSDALEGAYDQRQVERRPDVLTYSTPPFEKGLFVAGPVEVVLYVSSSAADTDFTAKLIDVYPDGTAYNLLEGIIRARYRDSFEDPSLMQPGKVYRVSIRLQDTANHFGPGHRLRLELSSSNFPRFDRNLNTGGNNFDETTWITAENTIYTGDKYPSHLSLQVMEK